MDVAIERETNLDAGPEFTLPDLRQLVPRTVVRAPQRLWTAYLDSRDLRLFDRRITLRHRLGEGAGVGIWTLKLPVEDGGIRTTRTELTWTGPLDTVPDGAMHCLGGVLRHQPLLVVAELECIRRRVRLQDEASRTFAEIDHDTVTVHGGAHDGLRFHEVEVETDAAAPASEHRVTTVLRRLRDAGAGPERAGPKLARALGRPGMGATSRMTADPTMGDVLSEGIGSSLGRLLDHDVRLRAADADPPARSIHQARVAARRLRSDLGTVASLIDPIWLGHVRDDLRWLGSALGEVRDCDVLADTLTRAQLEGTADDEGLAVLLAAVRRRRNAAGRDVAVVLGSDRYLALLDRLHAAVLHPPVTDPAVPASHARDVLPPLVDTERRRLAKAVRRARRQPTDRHLHRARIRAKQVRYASELASPVVGRRARATASSAKRLQTVLGHRQDAVVAQAWLRRQAIAGPGVVGFAAGQLTAAQRRRQLEARAGWASLGHRLTRADRHRWTTSPV